MRRRLYLMRHAHVSYLGEADPEVVHLTALGREQAAAARAALDGIDFDLVVTSSLPRTSETASIVAPGVEPEAWSEFAEWRGAHLGDVEPADLEQLFVGALHAHEESDRFLGGERSYFGRFEQAPACINVLDLGESGWIVRTVNYIPYDPLHPSRTTTMEDVWSDLVSWFDDLRAS